MNPSGLTASAERLTDRRMVSAVLPMEKHLVEPPSSCTWWRAITLPKSVFADGHEVIALGQDVPDHVNKRLADCDDASLRSGCHVRSSGRCLALDAIRSLC
jgi:hypothetical protein